MLSRRLKLGIDELDADENMKNFIREILIFEFNNIDEIRNYVEEYDFMVDKYLRDD